MAAQQKTNPAGVKPSEPASQRQTFYEKLLRESPLDPPLRASPSMEYTTNYLLNVAEEGRVHRIRELGGVRVVVFHQRNIDGDTVIVTDECQRLLGVIDLVRHKGELPTVITTAHSSEFYEICRRFYEDATQLVSH